MELDHVGDNTGKKQPKVHSNRPKIKPKSIKKRSWGGFWGSWRGLGESWRVLEELGAIFDRKNRQDGPKFASKMEPTWHQNRFKNLLEFSCFSGSVVGRILLGFGKDNAAKLVKK